MSLPFQHLTTALQLTKDVVEAVFPVVENMEKQWTQGGRSTLLEDKTIALLFYEPSSRTMLSFQAAVQGLRGGMILAQGKAMSSMSKGESIEDTIHMVSRYSDLVVMRHPEAGSADRAAAACTVPFINAGDGGNQHPTQALLDLYTIWKAKGTLDGLHVAFACDPLHSRTIRSLAWVLAQYDDVRYTLISPEDLKMSDDLRAWLDEQGVRYEETTDLAKGTEADILYMNRLQEERFEDRAAFEKHRKDLILTRSMVEGKDVLIMDPLPRLDEISPDVDGLPNAIYFDQAGNGVPVRMALLAMMLDKA